MLIICLWSKSCLGRGTTLGSLAMKPTYCSWWGWVGQKMGGQQQERTTHQISSPRLGWDLFSLTMCQNFEGRPGWDRGVWGGGWTEPGWTRGCVGGDWAGPEDRGQNTSKKPKPLKSFVGLYPTLLQPQLPHRDGADHQTVDGAKHISP